MSGKLQRTLYRNLLRLARNFDAPVLKVPDSGRLPTGPHLLCRRRRCRCRQVIINALLFAHAGADMPQSWRPTASIAGCCGGPVLGQPASALLLARAGRAAAAREGRSAVGLPPPREWL